MRNARRFILYLAFAIGAWLLTSFGGAMFDSANAAFWSDSLMWALLAFMVVCPALVFSSTPAGNSATHRSFADNGEKRLDPIESASKKHEHRRKEQQRVLEENSGRSPRAHA